MSETREDNTMSNASPQFVEIHALQTVPPSCVNRDDTGSPKSAIFGGVPRARVSSQAWKRATRDYFATHIDTDLLGYRTVDALGLITDKIAELDSTITSEDALALGEGIFKALGIKLTKKKETGALLFISPKQVTGLAQLAIDAHAASADISSKAAKAVMNIRQNPTLSSIDIACFGRMVAEAPDLNADAAVQVAHAICVDKMSREFDYYTAVDDLKGDDESGATMIGTVEFLSSTLYRYAVIDATHLMENLGNVDVAKEALRQFILGFCKSMPTGHQNSFANRTLPNALLVTIRDTQPINLSAAFERPVTATTKDIPSVAADRLAEHAQAVDAAYGTAPSHSFVISTVNSDALRKLATEPEANLTSVADAIPEIVYPNENND